jgi:hypothetical protein
LKSADIQTDNIVDMVEEEEERRDMSCRDGEGDGDGDGYTADLSADMEVYTDMIKHRHVP